MSWDLLSGRSPMREEEKKFYSVEIKYLAMRTHKVELKIPTFIGSIMDYYFGPLVLMEQ